MTIRGHLHDIASLLLSMADEAQFWSDDIGYRQAARRAILMAHAFRG